MTAIFPSQSLDVSVTASTTSSITLGSVALSSLAGQTIYITEGRRVWALTHLGGSTISFGDGQLLGGGSAAPPFTVFPTSYSNFTNQAFTAYTGALMRGFDPGGPNMRVNLGDFDYVELRDSGFSPDLGSDDGIWTGLYFVPDLGFTVANGNFFGTAIENGQPNLTPFQSVVTFDLDGLRPAIEVMSFSTNRTNLNGVLYLSSLCQGTQTPNTTNSQGRFDLTVNKRNIIVNIHIDNEENPVFPRDLPPLVVQASSTNLNGWLTWDGDTNGGFYVPDGRYLAVLSIRDHHGVEGRALSMTVKVISMKMLIKDISLNPAAITSEPAFTDSVITNLNYNVEMSNDSATTLAPSLRVLGWKDPNTGLFKAMNVDAHIPNGAPDTMVRALNCIDCSAWSLPETRFLFPDGSEAIEFPGLEGATGVDDDINLIRLFRADPRLFPLPANCTMLSPDGVNSVSYSSQTNGGDDNTINDYELMHLFDIVTGSNLNPTMLRANMGVIFRGDTPAEGNYRLQIRSTLSGINFDTDPIRTLSIFQCGSDIRDHFWPTARPENSTYLRGENIYVEDTSVFFKVSRYLAPVSDTTAPFVVTSDPISEGQVSPGIYSPTRPLTAQVRDNESPMSVQPSVTYARLFDPAGGPVGGSSATNGGGTNNSVNLVFTPFTPLRSGGTYIFQINACNVSGLCIQRDIEFTIKDETPPDVASVEVWTQTSLSPFSLPLNQTSPFGTPLDNVKEIWAALAIPPTSINTIDWDLSNISLNRISGTSSITVAVTRTTALGTIPSDGKIKFRLIPPITTAGLFEVVVQSFSKDLSGQGYSGPPAPWVNPRFTTIVNVAVLDVRHPNGVQNAISGQQPLTVTAIGVTYTPTTSNLQAVLPSFTGALLAPAGMQPLTLSANMSHALQFALTGPGTLFSPIRWDYDPTTPIRFTLYYNDSDLPTGVTNANLVVLGHDGTAWQTVPSVVHTSTNVTENTFVITAPLSSPAARIAYAIFYASASPNITPSPSPTQVPYKLTRSFNPTHSNPLFRLARFFYSQALPKEVDAKIYDTSGQLVRSLSLGRGIVSSDILSDPFYGTASYFFTWDGRNDSGNLVKNGIYLVRWRVLRFDGSSDVQTKPVALIK